MIWQKNKTDDSFSDLPSLSRKEALILAMLISGGREFYGLELVDASNGALKRGTVYVTLQRMQEKGFIDSRQEVRSAPEIGMPLRLYGVTGLGERVFAAYRAAHAVLTSEVIVAGAS